MRTILLLFLCSLALSQASAQDLDAHLRAAAELNPGVQARYAEFQAALKRSAQVRGLPDPSLTIGYFISPVETRIGPQRVRFSLVQMFPWFGTLGAQAEVADRQAEARYEAFLEARNELFFKVRAAYYPLHELERAIALERSDLEILRTYRAFALARFQGGTGSMVDVLRTDMMINAENTDIEILQERRNPLLESFSNAVGYTDPVVVNLSDSLVLVDLMTYAIDSIAMNPRLSELDRRAASALAQAEAARKMGLPRFGLGLDYMVVDERTDMTVPENGRDAIMPMLSVSLPIYRNKYRSAMEEAQELNRALEAMREQTDNELHTAYEVAYFEAHKGALNVQLMDQQIGIAKQALSLLLDAYSNSGDDLEEVLRMQEQVLRFRFMRLSAMREHHSAIAQLDHLTAKQIVRP
ncbi:MAG: TolC family protein [Flavobacteriales bacterium]|jgi:outer membrane protein TolC|nr:TolC family protein [Flavobacteriales bacterium]